MHDVQSVVETPSLALYVLSDTNSTNALINALTAIEGYFKLVQFWK